MEHRGIRYAIRIGKAREEWRAVIHMPEKRLPVERAVFGTREDAKTEARSMINAWMKKRDKATRLPDKRRQAAGAAPQRLKRRVRLSHRQVNCILKLIPAGVAGPHVADTTVRQML